MQQHGIKGISVGSVIPDYKRVFAFGVRKGADELREKLNQGLMIVKSNGDYQKIYEKWLTAGDPWLKYRKVLQIAIPIALTIALAAMLWTQILRQAVKRKTAELAAKNDELEKEIIVRKETQNALRLSEERLNLALTAAQEGVWDWDMERPVKPGIHPATSRCWAIWRTKSNIMSVPGFGCFIQTIKSHL